MIDTKSAKTRLLSLAFRGAIIDYPIKNCFNEALEETHKAQKNYVPVTEEERLIEAPAYWNWSRLGYLTHNHGQTTPDFDFCYIDVGTLDNVNHRLSENENLVAAKDAPSRARKKVAMGDVLYSTVRPYLHNICIVDKEFTRTPIASTAFCVMDANHSVLDNKFLFYWLLTSEFDKYSNGDPSKGALYPAIGEKDLLQGVIPIPPLEEQKQIVAKIDAAFSALDIIDALQARYSDNLAVLKAKLVDAAIQGKLTEQLTEDGTAEELYQQIQAEKQALAKTGKSKKEKALPEITDDEIPFEIPDSWKWVRLDSVCNGIVAGGDKPQDFSKVKDENHQIPVVANGVSNDGIMGYSSKATAPANTVTIAGRGTIGFPCYRNYEYIPVVRLIVVMPCENIEPRYLYYVFLGLPADSVGSSIPQLTVPMVKPKLIPLPPLAEQKRIIERMDEIIIALEK